ncbi:site-2 protease family protein [Cellulosilyticum ruminicola]|uniref:site-2 protease family protein n=1 Tax=Cellulosilyticum ruminicola TaxID=425254 RepID=UPI0006D28311|nr:site-2 protease family protein [Cellulosilyticum ruminicola]
MNGLVQQLIYSVLAVLIAICLHEYAHGFVSYLMGDPTPKRGGRLSLNPLHHLDPVGTLCLIFFHFGWAKPVMVNPNYYKNKKLGMAFVGIAGPLTNFIIAFFSMLGMGIIVKQTGGYAGDVIVYIFTFLNYLAIINIGLGSFNLIPFPPLDGAKIVGALLSEDKYFSFMRYERYGQGILMLLLVTNILDKPLDFIHSGITNGIWYMVGTILSIA